ncbi:MAG: phenylalanine--tRNA ligase subunit beta, partial [Nitrospinota bacterium]
ILEAAYFDPRSVRRTSKRLGISSESSYRFERGVNPEGLRQASLRAAQMMAGLAGGKAGGFIDEYPKKVEFPSIILRTRQVSDLLGIEIDDSDISGFLDRLGFEYSKEHKDYFSVQCPPYRHDMTIEADLMEEVARLFGYHNIVSTVARLAQHETKEPEMYSKRSRLNGLLAASGLSETINYSFINPSWRKWMGMGKDNAIEFKNRVNADWCELRTSLLPGLMNTAVFNIRQGEESIGIFETGVVFYGANGEGSEEFMSAGLITCGEEEIFGLRVPRDFSRLKGIVAKVIKGMSGFEPHMERPENPKDFLYPHRQVEIRVGSSRIGFLGQAHPLVTEKFGIDSEIVCFEISVDSLLQLSTGTVRAKPLPRFPGIKRDLALIVDESEEVRGLVKTIMETDPLRIRSCRVFDLYRGKQIPDGKKSVAFRLYFLDEGKTLTDETGDLIMKNILENAKENHGAQIRGT